MKVVENDGTSSYSQTILMNKQKNNQFAVVAYSTVMPETTFDLSLDALTEGQLEYELMDYNGALVYTEFQFLYPGLNEVQLSLKDLPEDIYKVMLKFDGEKEYLFFRKIGKKPHSSNRFTTKITELHHLAVFSPNGDKMNDTFEIFGIANFPENEVTIFNNQGNEIYTKNGYL